MTERSEPQLLGPFLGHVTAHSIKIWLHWESDRAEVFVTIHETSLNREVTEGPKIAEGKLKIDPAKLWTGTVEIAGLKPNTRYVYRLWTDAGHTYLVDLHGLNLSDLHFTTLSDNPEDQIDFLVMSCHNPTVSRTDGFDGHAVWADIPQIISMESNKAVRFALLVGDQVYADDWEAQILGAPDHQARLRLYLSAYRAFWSNINYRRVLCSIPAAMIWDDHDITDGWGSRVDSYVGNTSEFMPKWRALFDAASEAFEAMQASRNPPPLSAQRKDGFDSCFRINKWGFVLLDLRTNRNLRQNRMMTPDQTQRIRNWVEQNKKDMHTLFVVSPVVFSHGSPVVEDLTLSIWPYVLKAVDFFASKTKWGKGLQTKFNKTLGDISDDIKDSWASKENAAQADLILDYLFGLQNAAESPQSIVILSGDIHTSGYANIYSSDPKHASRASVPHITSSSVSYAPFNWLMEAIYRHASKSVALGKKAAYSSQVSHHFCSRALAVVSIRPKKSEGDQQMKVKYYLEGYPEPQILMFDLDRTSHRENITWVAQEALFTSEYAPTAPINIEAVLEKKSAELGIELNWRQSVVDLMKALEIDSSLGSRKKLAQKLGYTGSLNGDYDMNVWLRREIIKTLQRGGRLPADAS